MSRATRLAWLEERPEDRRFLARCLAKRPTDEEDPEDGDAADEDPDEQAAEIRRTQQELRAIKRGRDL
jgi:hypothetical protein